MKALASPMQPVQLEPSCSSPMRSRLENYFREHYAWLHQQLRRHTASPQGAEDVASEAFVQLAQRPCLEQVREPRALLRTIAKRVLQEQWRRNDLERAYLAELSAKPPAFYPSPEDQAMTIEALMLIDRALDEVPAKARRAFLLSQLDEKTYAEIGAELRVSSSMVRQYMTRALSAIVAALR